MTTTNTPDTATIAERYQERLVKLHTNHTAARAILRRLDGKPQHAWPQAEQDAYSAAVEAKYEALRSLGWWARQVGADQCDHHATILAMADAKDALGRSSRAYYELFEGPYDTWPAGAQSDFAHLVDKDDLAEKAVLALAAQVAMEVSNDA